MLASRLFGRTRGMVKLSTRFSSAENAPKVVPSEVPPEVPSSCPPPLKEGDKVPPVKFKVRVIDKSVQGGQQYKWKEVSTSQLLNNKRVVVFGLPGAFTPTCSATHLPGYEEKYDEIKSLGVDEVYCVSVNDAFVMRQWGLHQKLTIEDKDATNPLNPGNFKKVKLIPDGAAFFTRKMGMTCMWDTERGFGERSWRYSCVIKNGIIEKMFLEGGKILPNSIADPFEVSDANAMVTYLQSAKSAQTA